MSFIADTLTAVIEELRADSTVVIDEVLVNPPADPAALDREKKLPTILREFYAKADGAVISWHFREDPMIRGGIVIPLLENIHATRWSGFGMLDFNDDVHVYFNKRAADDSRVVAESLEGDEDIDFQDIAGGIVTIRSYFEAFRRTRGFRFWQETFNPDTDYTLESIFENRGYLWGSGDPEEVVIHSAHVPN